MNTANNKTVFLPEYKSIDRPYEVKDYPYGFRLRTSIFYWIESQPGKGDRLGTYTINPKNGKPNKPKYSTYATFMYLYIDENGHVKNGVIDSYDREEFNARFEFILYRIGLDFITDVQRNNLRANHYNHVRFGAPYEIVKYSDNMKEEYKKWLTATLTHIKSCPFENLVKYPARPTEDNPTGEVKMTITQYELKS
jgi:hypothetical protein